MWVPRQINESYTISQKECYICQMWGNVGPTPNPSGGGEVWEVGTLHNKNAFHVAPRFATRHEKRALCAS